MAQVEAKPFHTLVVDAGPIIKNTPSVSALLKKAHKLVTVPAVIAEIRDPATRSRVDVALIPFLEIRDPRLESVKAVRDLAKKTGDYAVLSGTDLLVAALAHDLDREHSRVVSASRDSSEQSTQSGTAVVGPSHSPQDENQESLLRNGPTSREQGGVSSHKNIEEAGSPVNAQVEEAQSHPAVPVGYANAVKAPAPPAVPTDFRPTESAQTGETIADVRDNFSKLSLSEISEPIIAEHDRTSRGDSSNGTESDQSSEDSDEEGWITPSNLSKHITKDTAAPSTATVTASNPLGVATVTTDFALQNVLLQLRLNLLSTTLQQIRYLRTNILRCHGCFQLVRDTTKQFCPRCGQPNLTRVAASTDRSGKLQVHLRKNWQWNHRGERYSVPKPTSGTASGRNVKGGGQGAWGNDLILAEDQREYVQAVSAGRRKKEKDLMDEDALPAILSGDRGGGDGKVKVGAGRNINAKRRSKR